LYELREKQRISVAAASKYFANVLYGYKGKGLSVGSMVAGYDHTGV
jgi:20S proteasome subunit beta 5